jgi:serralysin
MLRADFDVVVGAPVNTVPGPQSVQANTNAAIKGFKVFDMDASVLSASLAVEHGTLTIGAVGNVAVSGNGTGTVVLTGTVDDINAVLNAADNLVYRGLPDFFGFDTLTMTTTDDGFPGIGPQSDTDQVIIQVGPLLTGTADDDTFTALGGSARIDALGGDDTVTFNFRLVEATVAYAGDTVIVDGPASRTVLTGFENFVFTDGAVDNSDGNPLVDDLFYYSGNHDVWSAKVDAEQHYDLFGWREGRDPNAWFDADGYLAAYADVKAAGVNPLDHYATFGWREGRDPSADFDTTAYLAANPDVAAAQVNPLLHYLHFGIAEGRQAFADGVWG